MSKAPARPWSNLSSALQPAGGVQDTCSPAQQAADAAKKKNDLRREAIMAEGNLQQLLLQLADTQGTHTVLCCAVRAVLWCGAVRCGVVWWGVV